MARLSREDWLKRGLVLLVKHGVDSLTIDFMCQHLEVTKGSFYHHFKNRESFLEALLDYWETTYTTQFIEISRIEAGPLAQMQKLNELVEESYGTQETVIRAWAQVDPLAREYQERVDQRRIGFIRDLYLQLMDDETLAHTLAQLVYAILIGAQNILPAATQTELKRMFDLVEQVVISNLKEESE
jgi:AcrR family transcriptional regulator